MQGKVWNVDNYYLKVIINLRETGSSAGSQSEAVVRDGADDVAIFPRVARTVREDDAAIKLQMSDDFHYLIKY